jgi:hypothetical protein
VDALQSNPQLDDSSRLSLLQQIQSESLLAVRDALGDQAYGRYAMTAAGRWLGLIPTWTNGVAFGNSPGGP